MSIFYRIRYTPDKHNHKARMTAVYKAVEDYTKNTIIPVAALINLEKDFSCNVVMGSRPHYIDDIEFNDPKYEVLFTLKYS